MREKIISASRRTDIPAFYTPWFINRIRAGFCVYPNPLYPNKFYRVSLDPADVLGIVFWTRFPAPLFRYLRELDSKGFVYYFQYTVIGYARSIDVRSPRLEAALKVFRELSSRIGSDRVIWRYDPVILSREIDEKWHQDNFRRIADNISNHTQRLVVSVVDPYRKTQRRLGSSEDGTQYDPESYSQLFSWITGEANRRGLLVQSCAETKPLTMGITPGSCVDAQILSTLRGKLNPFTIRFHNQREGCLCHQSTDIGVNDSCGFGCQYCYAVTNHQNALINVKRHHPDWTCISGDVHLDEKPDPVGQQKLF